MTMYRILLCFMFLSSTYFFAQEKGVSHVVVKGETIYQISKKYKVTVEDIFKLNPTAETGIKENDILLITKPSTVDSDLHIVKPKETLYSIARDYKVSFGDLKALNETALTEGLKIGQSIKIPVNKVDVVVKDEEKTPVNTEKVKTIEPAKTVQIIEQPVHGKFIIHTVEAKETKFGIAKKYGTTISELEKNNPEIISSLPIGFKLKVKENSTNTQEAPKKDIVTNQDSSKDVTIKDEAVTVPEKKAGYARYEVKAKETLYSLSQTLGITQDELLELNPVLKDGVKEGTLLIVPAKNSLTILTNSKFKDLTKSINVQKRKQLVLLFPFNAAKIESDSINNLSVRLKKDNFLNMTLDFYSGALMAIDYGKSLGLNLDIKILDSEETKTSSSVEKVVKENNLQNADAIIGPFYQQYAEKVAELVGNVPVISPLSKEIGKPFANLYQSMPPADFTKKFMLDYLVAQKGNIIVVSDVKRQSNRDFISKNYPDATFAQVTAAGVLDVGNFQSLYDVNVKNYVILDNEKTGTILSVLKLMSKEMRFYEQQLVILEPNETLDFEEISMNSIASLKLLYPSLTRDSGSNELNLFEIDYKKKNKTIPNQFATRGFDITFDTMLRLSQEKTILQSLEEDKTEQLESKFEYIKKDSECYINNGVYILEYQEDLTVKPVN